MLVLQIACITIVLVYLVGRFRMDPQPRIAAARLALLSIASWVGEDSVIRAYHFYQYDPGWWLFIDQVPLLIVVIWPIVIDSAGRLAEYLVVEPGWASRRRAIAAPLLGAAFVLADASLIEPVAVRSSLWSWNAPGVFHVPPIGILGWAIFAFPALMLIRQLDAGGPRSWLAWTTPVLAPIATHLMLLACWWGAFRWINHPVDSDAAVAVGWLVLGGLSILSWAAALRRMVPVSELVARVPAASFFFVLLALHGRSDLRLVLWTLAFAPPYLSLMSLRRRA